MTDTMPSDDAVQPGPDEAAGAAQASGQYVPADADAPATPAPAADDDAAAQQADVDATVEAILFASDKPLPATAIAKIGEFVSARVVRLAMASLNAKYESIGCSFRIVDIAGGLQMQTLPQYSDVLSRLIKSRGESRLSQAAMEALAVVAYRQPVLRADIEAIRGVACGEVLRSLMDRNLVKIVGRAEEIGRPMLYGTTKFFLEVFGLSGLDDLPNAQELRKAQRAEKPAPAAPATGETAPTAAPAATDAQTDAQTSQPVTPAEQGQPFVAAEAAAALAAVQPEGDMPQSSDSPGHVPDELTDDEQ